MPIIGSKLWKEKINSNSQKQRRKLKFYGARCSRALHHFIFHDDDNINIMYCRQINISNNTTIYLFLKKKLQNKIRRQKIYI